MLRCKKINDEDQSIRASLPKLKKLTAYFMKYGQQIYWV